VSDYSTYVFDLDGVLYLGDTAIPYATQTIERLQSLGKSVYFLTNNSGSTRAAYVEKLKAVNGLSVSSDQIYTSALACALYLRERGASGKTAFVIGEAGLVEDLEQTGGLRVVTRPDAVGFDSVDYVIVGIDRQFSYEKLCFAHLAITRGHAEFIATNRDATYPMEGGTVPGAGSLVISVATATGREPLTIGKPEPPSLQAILTVSGSPAERTVMVGDRLDTDILVGNRLGTQTVLVLTGVTPIDAARAAPPACLPHRIIPDLRELL